MEGEARRLLGLSILEGVAVLLDFTSCQRGGEMGKHEGANRRTKDAIGR